VQKRHTARQTLYRGCLSATDCDHPGDAGFYQHLACSLDILKKFYPWEYERSRNARLTDPNGILAGRFQPTVRQRARLQLN
jgi:hypothetical protein